MGTTEAGIERREVLQRCLEVAGGGLVLFEAPAGFGKTYALVQWCEHALRARHIVVWLDLRPTERPLASLASRLLEAFTEHGLQNLPPPITAQTEDSQHELSTFVTALVRGIAKHGRRVLLALDDYHRIEGGSADALLRQLFEQAPANLLVGLAGRRTCPIAPSKLLLQGRLHRVGPRSLLFSKSEARDFLGRSLGAWQLNSLYQLSEGWPAALKVAQMCLTEWPRDSADIRTVPEFTRLIGNYCIDAVLRDVGPDAVDLLSDCAILQTLEPGPCDAIRHRRDSLRILSDLAAHETFLETVDFGARTWRLPLLLRETLARGAAERSADSTAAAHANAAEYFAAAGRIQDAVRHYLDANAPEAAATALERVSPLAMAITQGEQHVQALLDLIPATLIQRYPRLALCQTYVHNMRGHFDEANALLAETASLTEDFTRDRPGGNDELLRTEFLCLELTIDFLGRSCAPLEHLRSIEAQLLKIGKSHMRLVGPIRIILAMLYLLRGDLELAEAHLIECFRLNVTMPTAWTTLWLEYHGGALALARGKLMEARYRLQAGLKLWRKDFHSYHLFRDLSKIALAEIDYETDSLSEARIKLGEGLYASDTLEGSFDSLASLYETAMMLHWHARQLDQLRSLLARGVAIRRAGELLARFLWVLRLRLELLQGQLEAANKIITSERFAEQWDRADFMDHLNYREWDLLGLCLCHFAIHTQDFNRARSIGARLEQTARRAGRARTIVKAQALQAAIAYRQGEQESAVERLLQALELAQPLGHRRVFLDEGELIHPILQVIKDRVGVPPHAAAYASSLCHELRAKHKDPAVERDILLSDRELDVLRELSLGHSNKLIARKLGLAAPTIKFHINNVFRKLGVHKRAAAVAEAHRRGWFS